MYSHFNISRKNNQLDEQQSGQKENGSGIESELRKQRQLYQFGKTKIFFRPGQVALLERIRSQKLRECAILMQRMVRGWLVRRQYLLIKKSILLLQRYSRGYLARKWYLYLRQTRAAIIIQTAWRVYHQLKVYRQIRQSTLALQTCGRAYLARKRYQAIKENLAAITIQRYWRGYSARKTYRDTKQKIILVQSCIRRHLARKELRQLRIEARSVEHVTNLNKGLEKKIIELQQRIDELADENRLSQLTVIKYDQLRTEFETMETENVRLRSREKEDLLSQQQYKSENEKLMTINKELVDKVEKLSAQQHEMEAKLQSTITAAKQSQVNSKTFEQAVKQREEQLQIEFDRERKVLQTELERETSSRQQLLSRIMDLESSLECATNSSSNIDNERAAVAAASVALAKATSQKLVHHSHSLHQQLSSTTQNNSSSVPSPTTMTESNELMNRKDLSLPLNKTMETISSTSAAVVAQPQLNNAVDNTYINNRDFDTNLQQISVMMRCTELEQEMFKLKDDNQKLRRYIAKTVDSTDPGTVVAATNGDINNTSDGTVDKSKQGAQLLAEQFAELEDELERYKKERADLKKVILLEDWITTGGGTVDEKYQNNLLSAYKSMYTQLDEEINKKNKLIQKLKYEWFVILFSCCFIYFVF